MTKNPNAKYENLLRKEKILGFWHDFQNVFNELPKWERPVHIFWLLGPFILLLERTPADLWLSLIALTFAGRSIWKRQGWWLRSFWVKAAFLFWAACLFAAAVSPLPAYSLGEAFVWFRFPLFAMAVAFWLGRDRRFVYAMLASICAGMLVMCVINAAEMTLVGQVSGRLSWPYGDLVPGNYLAKACLPAFLVVVALATSARSRVAGVGIFGACSTLDAALLNVASPCRARRRQPRDDVGPALSLHAAMNGGACWPATLIAVRVAVKAR